MRLEKKKKKEHRPITPDQISLICGTGASMLRVGFDRVSQNFRLKKTEPIPGQKKQKQNLVLLGEKKRVLERL